ncbi:hypothetical protein MNEG_6267 [Monoraphidium neglectum]|uniref:L-2-hydroxyglutarate dehydrogenase, mitochondrial n=1 Tax=Monoraphidium neglectum TaxID=145388 RepID=A0A0D2JRT9_9CHLO|nr:hypothetical protein MNEG_6267 [Monoraphidium neglectum]KIZ01693.1 hypothetical protein MNEG_6267 [Monoraphidium neglectum]|eukprot:XP_013900712.1 hypothetical protein MNEG_6267 [Monoraphidium neglectum]
MDVLWLDAESAGASMAVHSRVTGVTAEAARKLVHVEDVNTGERSTVGARWLVNAAGLGAQAVAASIQGVPASSIPPRRLAKGSYFALSGCGAPFSHLIYPLPEDGGLGVHLTIDLGGQAKFGPDVEWVDSIDYSVDPSRGDKFYSAIRSYWPGLRDGALVPSYSGVRPKVSGPGEPAADFVLQGARRGHGVRGLVNLFGIESPGLTASMAIAARVLALLRG